MNGDGTIKRIEMDGDVSNSHLDSSTVKYRHHVTEDHSLEHLAPVTISSEFMELVTALASMDSDAYKATLEESKSDLMHRLDELQQVSVGPNWGRLVQAIHRLQSQVLLQQQELAQHQSQHRNGNISKEQTELQYLRERNPKLEKAVKKLAARNAKLKEALVQQRTDKKLLIRQMKGYMQHQNERVDTANQLLVHERYLRRGGLRSRSSSRDSLRGGGVDDGEDSTALDDESAMASIGSLPSCVTDDGIATVQFVAEPPDQQPDTVTLHFGSLPLQMIGLQFTTVPASVRKPPSIELDEMASLRKKMKNMLQKTTANGSNPDGCTCKEAFLVCGNYGFDDSLVGGVEPPPVGSRLIQLDGQSVEEEGWSLDKIRSCILGGVDDDDDSFTLTFRHDPLSKKQQVLLHEAIQTLKERHTRARAPRQALGAEDDLDALSIEEDLTQQVFEEVFVVKHNGGKVSSMVPSFLQYNKGTPSRPPPSHVDTDAMDDQQTEPISTTMVRSRLGSWMRQAPADDDSAELLEVPSGSGAKDIDSAPANVTATRQRLPSWMNLGGSDSNDKDTASTAQGDSRDATPTRPRLPSFLRVDAKDAEPEETAQRSNAGFSASTPSSSSSAMLKQSMKSSMKTMGKTIKSLW